MKIEEHISLKKFTTMKIGGIARYFCSVATEQELTEAFQFAATKKLPMVILGGGSNVLISDKDIDALVIKMYIRGTEWQEEKEHISVTVGAGEHWDTLVAEAVNKGFWGIENLSGIPGTVGAAPIQNIGAYGAELADVFEWVEALDPSSGVLLRLDLNKCQFGYRDSIFKHPEGKLLIVTRVSLRLRKSGVPNLGYKDLKTYFSGKSNPSLDEIREAVLEIRSKKFPNLNEFGTSGSFFKNPIVSKEKFDELKKKFPNLPGFELSVKDSNLKAKSYKLKAIKIPLAWILDNICGLKGFTKGNVSLFERQPIVLVHNGLATADEVEAFAKEIIAQVKIETGIDVEWEVQKMK